MGWICEHERPHPGGSGSQAASCRRPGPSALRVRRRRFLLASPSLSPSVAGQHNLLGAGGVWVILAASGRFMQCHVDASCEQDIRRVAVGAPVVAIVGILETTSWSRR